MKKAALRAIKHLFPPPRRLPEWYVYCVHSRVRDFELNLKSGGPILWQPGVKCRSVAPGTGLSAEKLRDPGTKAPKGRYRFTPSSLGRDTGCGRTVQFRFRFELRVKKLLFGFIGSTLPLMIIRDDRIIVTARRFAAVFLQLVANVFRFPPDPDFSYFRNILLYRIIL